MSSDDDLLATQIQRIAQEMREEMKDDMVLNAPKEAGEVEDGCDFPLSSPNWPFNQLSVDYSVLGCAEIDVVDASQMTPFFFYKNYVAKNRPVVINGLIDNWPAMKKWPDDKYLLSKIGDCDVTIDYTPDGRADAIINNGNYPILTSSVADPIAKSITKPLYTTQPTSESKKSSNITIPTGLYSDLFAVPMSKVVKFRDFLPQLSLYPEMIHNHPHKDLELEYLYSLYKFNQTQMGVEKKDQVDFLKEILPPQSTIQSIKDISCSLISRPSYLPGVPYCQKQNGSFIEEYGPLHDDIPLDGFGWANECFDNKPVAVNIWMGSSFSHTSLHQDWFENMYCVIEGVKQFALVPPSEVYWLRKKRLPTVRWAIISQGDNQKQENDKKQENVENLTNIDNNGNSLIIHDGLEAKEIQLQVDNKGRKYYHLSVKQQLVAPEVQADLIQNSNQTCEKKNQENEQKTPEETTEQETIYRFYVVDRTNGDNSEYYDLEDLLNEQKEIEEKKKKNKEKHVPKSGVYKEEFDNLDFGHAHRPYLVTSNQHLHINTDITEVIEGDNVVENGPVVKIYPLIMVSKGSYVTVPCFSSKPSSYVYGDNDDDVLGDLNESLEEEVPKPKGEVSIEIIKDEEGQEEKKDGDDNDIKKSLKMEDYLESIYKDLQVTPWIDVDVEINPINFTPGSTRSKHQHTNSHIVRYLASVKKGQTLYLPRQWYHSVRQQGKTISINYWYDMEFDGHFVLHEFMRRIAEQKHRDE